MKNKKPIRKSLSVTTETLRRLASELRFVRGGARRFACDPCGTGSPTDCTLDPDPAAAN
jgi:hypothetical protein